MVSYVYLKFNSNTNNSLSTNVIPLNATTVGISVSKVVPAFPVPLSGIPAGESITLAIDAGMATKNISINGFINDTTLTKTVDGVSTTRKFTAHEIAQMISSSVDSTGIAINQAISELIVLYPSFVASDYNYRGTCNISANKNKTDCEAAGGTWTQAVNDNSSRDEGTNIPYNFASRGDKNSKDNINVPAPISTYPDNDTSKGVTGYIRSFTCNFEAEAHDISFSLEFEAATVFP